MPETTDPTFYRSPAAAIAAPPESLAYVAAFDPAGEKRDAMAVVDCDRDSSTYGDVVGWAELPTAGNELHHFGWNACSSALCHEGHEGMLERRYLIVPGIRSSRTYVLDTKPDPRQPHVVRTIEAEELAAKAGYSRPHTVHCGPGGIFMSNLGAAGNGDGPGGVALIDHDTFEVTGAWETDRGDQYFAYDVWWHLNEDVAVTSEWATPSMIEDGLNPEDLLGKRFGHHLDFWSLSEGKLVQRVDLGDEHQMVLEVQARPRPARDLGLRRRRDQRRGPVRLGLALAPRRRQLGGREGDHDPGGAGRRRQAAAGAAAVRRGAAADQRHRPVRRRPLALRLLLGHRRVQAVRRQRPPQPDRDRLGPARRDRRPQAPPRRPRLPLAGGPQMVEISRDGRRVYFTNSLYASWDEVFYPDGVGAWMARLDADVEQGGMSVDPQFFPNGDDFRGLRVHQTRLQGGDASSDSYCFVD